jgi:nicotinamidase-related amidase
MRSKRRVTHPADRVLGLSSQPAISLYRLAARCQGEETASGTFETLARGYDGDMADTALLVVDMLNAYRHPDAEFLTPNVAPIVEPLSELISRARSSDQVDLIYVNDNYGDFTADYGDIVKSALEGERPDLVKPILPEAGCRIMTKVRHSAFYSTPLEYLLGQLGVQQVILTGQVTEQCILYSALDAYVRHFEVVVPTDAVAHIDDQLCDAALRMIERNMGGTLITAAECKF